VGVLVDTSVWIDYFRNGENSKDLDKLIDEDLIVTNEVILAELVPFLKLKRQHKVIGLLLELIKSTLNVNWLEIIEFQTSCLKSGANSIGLPDLMIAQNALQNELEIFSLDKHFKFLQEIIDVQLYKKIG
jgi:predicted nucleic acid-binding protein